MKVLMTADCVGGVWTYALELANALAERDVETTLATMGGPLTAEQRRELRSSRLRRAYAERYALEWMEQPWGDVAQAGEWLLGIEEEVQPDLVHLNGYAHASLPWRAPTLVVGHSCVLSWHEAVRRRPAGLEWRRYRAAVEEGLSAASLLVAPTRAMLDDLIRLYDPPCPRLVVPNGRRRAIPRATKRELVLCAGRVWDEAKNVQALVRVAPRLPWPVAVAGDGQPGDGVIALGPLPRAELDRTLALASIYAAPARYEPFGLAALEAALAGCALVLGDIPSLREVWGDAAVFVPPDDDERLEAELVALIQDERRRLDLAARARKRAGIYTPERMAEGYLRAYAGLTSAVEVA